MPTTERVSFVLTAQDMASPHFNRLNRSIQDVDQSSKELNQTSKQTNTSFGNLTTGINSAVAAIGVAGFAQIVGDLNNVGVAAQGTKSIFTNLAAEVGGADNLLSQLRSTTGRVVDDMTLMTGASQLMRMGLADSASGVNELINMAVRLKQPTETAQEAIENFSLMLANQSVARLDSFGISSGRVRARIDELIKSGQALNREQAFTMAVLEEGGAALDRLGDAVNINESAFNRLGVRLENAKNGLAEFVATGIEAGAMLIELVGLTQELGEVTAARRYAEENGLDPNNLEYNRTAVNFLGQEIVLSESGTVPGSTSLPYADPYVGSRDDYTQGTVAMTPEQLSMMNIRGREAMVGARARYMLQSGVSGGFNAVGNAYESFLAPGQADYDRQFTNFQSRFGELQNNAFQGTGNLGLMTPDAIASSISGYEQLKQLQMQMEDHPFVREDQVVYLDRMVDHAQELANQARAAEAAFENMSLSEMLGQSGGGRLGELSDMVAGLISEEGGRDSFQEAADLASGRETELSMAVQDEVAPTIAQISEQLGQDAAVLAMESVLAAIEDGQVAGLGTDQILSNVNSQLGYAVDSEGQLQPNFAGSEFDNMEMAAMGVLPGVPGMGGEDEEEDSMLSQAQQISDVVSGWTAESFTTEMETNLAAANEFAMLMEEAGNAQYKSVWSVDVKFNFSDSRGSEMLADKATQIMNDNGGIIPEG